MTILTEEEAKKKLCPFSLNGEFQNTENYKCFGSKCMAWRWVYEDKAGRPNGTCALIHMDDK